MPLLPVSYAGRLAARDRPAGRSPQMLQTWDRLLFLHWKWPTEVIQSLLPRGLWVDTFEEEAYLGVVPFFMRDVRFRGLPAFPWISNFLETNLRTYVRDEHGTPGVWFFTLDANQPLAVWWARRFFHLNYKHARISAQSNAAEATNYSVQRRDPSTPGISQFSYQPVGTNRLAAPGSLEFFLIERYVLFTRNARSTQLQLGRVHHQPYPLRDVNLSAWDDQILRWHQFDSKLRTPDHAVMSPGVTVEVFGLEPVPPH